MKKNLFLSELFKVTIQVSLKSRVIQILGLLIFFRLKSLVCLFLIKRLVIIMIIMNCFYRMVDQWRALALDLLVEICMFKGNNRNTRTRCEICSKLTIQQRCIGVVLVSLMLTLNIFHTLFCCFYWYFEQVNKCQLGYFKPTPLLDVLMNTSIRYAITKFESVPNQSSWV